MTEVTALSPQETIRLLHEELEQTNQEVMALTLELDRRLDALRLEIRERQKAESELRANEQRLRDIVETSQDWIWELDSQGRFRFCSGAVTRMLGYAPTELIGKDYRIYLHEDERNRAASLLPAAGDAELSGAVARWRGADGQLRWLERNVLVMLDSFKRTIGYRGTDRDITVRRDQEARLQRLTRTYRMLSSTGSAILRLHDRIDLLREVCRIAVQQGGYERAVISLIDANTKMLQPYASAGADSEELRAFDRAVFAPQSQRMLERTLRTGLRLVLNDLIADRRSLVQGDLLISHGYQAFAALPLQIDRTAVGVITLFSSQRGIFDKAELSVLLELSANLGFALQYLEKDEAVHFLSYFDSLTGLAKRALFCQRLGLLLGAEEAAGRSRAVVTFDLQQLSVINDSFGRYVGDRLLEEIAARLKQAYESEHAAYFGGGTFGLTFSCVAQAGETGRLLQDAAGRLFSEPIVIDGHELRPAVRSGLAIYPHDAKAAETLVQYAEAALKAAREDNERYVLYGMIRERPTSRKVALEARLAGALDRDEFLLHYQPKIDVASGKVAGFEALIRWQDAQEGLVPPSIFIPLLERSGAIVEVGEWVLRQAAHDIRRWSSAGLGPIRVAVNVSPLQLRRRDFVEKVMASASPSSENPVRIDIEITESMLMQDIDLSIRKLTELRSLGIGVAIDDFGTGYSSLRLLAGLPVDTLKVDRTFIQALSAPGGLTLVSTIVSLARAFSMRSVAEGVESTEQLDTLRKMHCDEAQGYLFARPMAAADVPSIVTRFSAAK
jgi:PAS domain S-box-containing protein/diguanylate cyclase (GGDEF)-like protein